MTPDTTTTTEHASNPGRLLAPIAAEIITSDTAWFATTTPPNAASDSAYSNTFPSWKHPR